jgi:hypothetical protein
MMNNPKERQMEKDEKYQWRLIRLITERFDYYLEDIKQISEQKDYLHIN